MVDNHFTREYPFSADQLKKAGDVPVNKITSFSNLLQVSGQRDGFCVHLPAKAFSRVLISPVAVQADTLPCASKIQVKTMFDS